MKSCEETRVKLKRFEGLMVEMRAAISMINELLISKNVNNFVIF